MRRPRRESYSPALGLLASADAVRRQADHTLSIIAGAIDERSQAYYVVGSVLEVALHVGIVHYAWRWPRASIASGDRG